VYVVLALEAGTSQDTLDVEGVASVSTGCPCEQTSATPPCSKDTVPVGAKLEPREAFATTARSRTVPGDNGSGAPESEVVVEACTTVTATPCAEVTLLEVTVPWAGVYEAPKWYAVEFAARAVIEHDAMPFTTGTAWQMGALENSGFTEVPFSEKSTIPEVTGLLPFVSSTLATTVSSSP
jgi:hypothetical protein